MKREILFFFFCLSLSFTWRLQSLRCIYTRITVRREEKRKKKHDVGLHQASIYRKKKRRNTPASRDARKRSVQSRSAAADYSN